VGLVLAVGLADRAPALHAADLERGDAAVIRRWRLGGERIAPRHAPEGEALEERAPQPGRW
jgi:hypothetical protein